MECLENEIKLLGILNLLFAKNINKKFSLRCTVGFVRATLKHGQVFCSVNVQVNQVRVFAALQSE